MKKLHLYLLIAFVGIKAINTSAQVTVTEAGEFEIFLPESGTWFMDYRDDYLMVITESSTLLTQGTTTGINSDMSVNSHLYNTTYLESDFQVVGIEKGDTTGEHWLFSFDPASNTLMMMRAFYVDETGIIVANVNSLLIPAVYSSVEVRDVDYFPGNPGGPAYLGFLLSVLDTEDNKDKAILAFSEYTPAGFTSGLMIEVSVGNYATFPWTYDFTSVGEGESDVAAFIWGKYSKNEAGSTHDNFLTRINSNGEIAYSKSYASYTESDDEAIALVTDGPGNLYGVSHSADNDYALNAHVAIFKINKTNGKKLWVRRIGEALAGTEIANHVAGNPYGAGIALTGSFEDGTGGRNGRTWRVLGNGSVAWQKTINLNPVTGSIEEGRMVGFDPTNNNVIVVGFFEDRFWAAGYISATGANAWPTVEYNGVYAGDIDNDRMLIDFGTDGDIYVTARTCDIFCNVTVVKYEQTILRDAPVEKSSGVSVFPNPTSSFLQVEGLVSDDIITIYDLTGKLVYQAIATSDLLTIDASDLTAGYYYIAINRNGDVNSSGFVKSN